MLHFILKQKRSPTLLAAAVILNAEIILLASSTLPYRVSYRKEAERCVTLNKLDKFFEYKYFY